MFEPKKCIGQYLTERYHYKLTLQDAIIYALGIGFSQDPLNENDLDYTYEDKDFKIFPLISVARLAVPIKQSFQLMMAIDGVPQFNPMQLLHGEQRTEIYEQLKIDTEYQSKLIFADVADKGKGALITQIIEHFEIKTGKLVGKNFYNLYVRGMGGFGYKGSDILQDTVKKPNTPPTKKVIQKTYPNQAIIYRLSGDDNPLHIDPSMSGIAGFDKPILHGLCTYGLCGKVVVQELLGNDQTKMKAIQARFLSVVFPGETLEISFWDLKNNVYFEASVLERKKVVINGFVECENDNNAKL